MGLRAVSCAQLLTDSIPFQELKRYADAHLSKHGEVALRDSLLLLGAGQSAEIACLSDAPRAPRSANLSAASYPTFATSRLRSQADWAADLLLLYRNDFRLNWRAEGIPPQLHSLFRRAWDSNPHARVTITEVMQCMQERLKFEWVAQHSYQN